MNTQKIAKYKKIFSEITGLPATKAVCHLFVNDDCRASRTWEEAIKKAKSLIKKQSLEESKKGWRTVVNVNYVKQESAATQYPINHYNHVNVHDPPQAWGWTQAHLCADNWL